MGLIGGEVFCVHGGIGANFLDSESLQEAKSTTSAENPSMTSLTSSAAQIVDETASRTDRSERNALLEKLSSRRLPLKGLNHDDPFWDFFWADPANGLQEELTVENRERNTSVLFGRRALESFLRAANLRMVVRGHQLCSYGYEFIWERQLLTLFSAPNYCGTNNVGAIAEFDVNDFYPTIYVCDLNYNSIVFGCSLLARTKCCHVSMFLRAVRPAEGTGEAQVRAGRRRAQTRIDAMGGAQPAGRWRGRCAGRNSGRVDSGGPTKSQRAAGLKHGTQLLRGRVGRTTTSLTHVARVEQPAVRSAKGTAATEPVRSSATPDTTDAGRKSGKCSDVLSTAECAASILQSATGNGSSRDAWACVRWSADASNAECTQYRPATTGGTDEHCNDYGGSVAAAECSWRRARVGAAARHADKRVAERCAAPPDRTAFRAAATAFTAAALPRTVRAGSRNALRRSAVSRTVPAAFTSRARATVRSSVGWCELD